MLMVFQQHLVDISLGTELQQKKNSEMWWWFTIHKTCEVWKTDNLIVHLRIDQQAVRVFFFNYCRLFAAIFVFTPSQSHFCLQPLLLNFLALLHGLLSPGLSTAGLFSFVLPHSFNLFYSWLDRNGCATTHKLNIRKLWLSSQVGIPEGLVCFTLVVAPYRIAKMCGLLCRTLLKGGGTVKMCFMRKMDAPLDNSL